MKTRAYKTGFTLIEMVMVVAIIAILVSMIVGVTKRFGDQSRERQCRNTIALLGNALEQFRDFGFEYKDDANLTFPLDCNGYSNLTIFANTLHNALYSANPADPPNITISGGTHDLTFSGSEALYFILSQVPDCRATLAKIDKSLLTNDSNDRPPAPLTITIISGTTTTVLPFTRIIDPWKTPLRYDYYPEFADYMAITAGGTWQNYLIYRDSAKRTFPLITSAGPDKLFDTADDITNVK
jgi:prepilin-type N-terminal cleavage/methylation domain-containing protein